MDIGLQKIKTGVNLWTIKKRIQNARENILKTRPEATDYIKGAEAIRRGAIRSNQLSY
jgi:hypothetical protein